MSQLLAVPNVLTLSRLILLPFIVWLTYAERPPALTVAVGLFTVAVATDWADGYVARVWGLVTRTGTLLDQAVDKVMVLSLLLVFSQRGLLPLWLVLLNLFREFLVADFRVLAAARGHTVGSNWMGKTKFDLQVVLIYLMYAFLLARTAGRSISWGQTVIFLFALAITLLSFAFAALFFVRHRDELGAGPQHLRG